MYWTYILLCENGAFYTGQTRKLAHRCMEHREGNGARYTRANRPIKLVYYEALPSRSAALKREHEVRSLTRSQKTALVREFGETPSLRRLNRLLSTYNIEEAGSLPTSAVVLNIPSSLDSENRSRPLADDPSS